jgi:hypothetical protein
MSTIRWSSGLGSRWASTSSMSPGNTTGSSAGSVNTPAAVSCTRCIFPSGPTRYFTVAWKM